MPVNVYECMFILDSSVYAREQGSIAGQIAELITKLGGQIMVSRLWEERRLAYPIGGHRKGAYWLSYFKLDSARLPSFQRECQLREMVLRHLVLRVDPRIAEALVSHAQSGVAGETRSAQRATAPAASAPPVPEIAEDAEDVEEGLAAAGS